MRHLASAGHGTLLRALLDEPELLPVLRQLLTDLEATAAAFREALRGLRTEA